MIINVTKDFKVTVVIPTYNRYDVLMRALESVYAQTILPDEVIVVDDGSSDNTLQIQEDFPKVRSFFQKNSGVSSARNLGIKKANYEWIAFLDSDDEWLSEKLQKQIDFHKNNPDILMSYTDEIWIRNSVKIKIPKKFCKIGEDVFLENLEFCNIAPSSAFIHKSVFDKIGIFDENLEVCEDYDLWLRIALEYEIGLVKEALIRKYAGHDDQLSFKHWGMDRFRVIALEKHLDYNGDKKALILETALKKYKILLAGAKKYDKLQDIKKYSERIHELSTQL